MCGRYVLATPASELVAIFEPEDSEDFDWEPRYSIAPSTRAPVVREFADDLGTHRTIERAAWGLRPSWAKEKGPRPINARLETVASNGMFRAGFAGARCIVPMSGYYEWTEEEGGKHPHYLHSPGLPVLNAAGITAARKDESTGEWSVSFTIITREARDAGGTVHDRMPVFLPDAFRAEWLAPGKPESADALVDELRRQSDEIATTMAVHAVDRRLNNVRTVPAGDPTLLEPIA